MAKDPQKAFRTHQRGAARRGIPFLMTFDEWWDWWQTDNRWEQRGAGGDRLVMARKRDEGPYHLDNIYCAESRVNVADGSFYRHEKRGPQEPRSTYSYALPPELADRLRELAERYGVSVSSIVERAVALRYGP